MTLDEHAQSIGLPDGRVFVNGEAGAFLLDPVADRWEITRPSLRARDRGLAITAEGWLLACGGVEGSWLKDGCELLRPDTNTWQPMPALPAPVAHLSCATACGRVFVAGGFERQPSGGGSASKTLLSWAPGELAWQRHADMPFATDFTPAVALTLADDSIIFAYQSELARFCDGAWTPLDGGVDGAALAALPGGGFMRIGGGGYRQEAIADVRIWDREWRDGPALPKPRKLARTIRVGDRIAILGGYWTASRWEDVYDGGEIDMPEGRHYRRQVVDNRAHADLLVEASDGWQALPSPPIDGACYALGAQCVIAMAQQPIRIEL